MLLQPRSSLHRKSKSTIELLWINIGETAAWQGTRKCKSGDSEAIS
jgi:hypothetical protein